MEKKNIWAISVASALIVVAVLATVVLLVGKSTAKESGESVVNNHYVNVIANPPLPDTMTFCGEKVPLDNEMVREALDRELTTVCYQHSTTLMCLKRSGRCFPVIERVLRENGMPQDLKYVCVAESSLANVTSSASAVGYWQFLENTAKIYGLEVRTEVDQRYDLEASTRAACKYLKNAKNKFGTWAMAAAAYNRGEGGVQAAVNSQSQNEYWNMYFNPETARYVYRIMAYKLVFENPQIYGVRLKDNEKYHPWNCENITVDSTITDMYAFCKNNGMTYKELKELNPWIRSTKLTVSSGKSYTIKKLAKHK